jgi:hypothetical protein
MPTLKLYKFIDSKFADEMITRGSVRIGTGSDFRLPDGKTGGRADANEMLVVWKPPPGLLTVDKNHPFLKGIKAGQEMPDGRTIQLMFADGVQFNLHGDACIYCTSLEADTAIRDRMKDNFGADACITIEDARRFAEAVSVHPFLAGRIYYGGAVKYIEKKPSKQYPPNDPFEKSKEFEWQREFRFVWLGEMVKPEVITVPKITGLLNRIY